MFRVFSNIGHKDFESKIAAEIYSAVISDTAVVEMNSLDCPSPEDFEIAELER